MAQASPCLLRTTHGTPRTPTTATRTEGQDYYLTRYNRRDYGRRRRATFRVARYARDTARLYYEGVYVRVRDLATFELLERLPAIAVGYYAPSDSR
jgi:hypothetical protein